MNIKREFLSGTEISQRFILDDQGRENYNFSFSYPLLPTTNNELENQYYELKKEIFLTKSEYLKLKDAKIIELSSDYLGLLNHLKEVENLARIKTDAADDLKRAEKKSEINEITQSELLAAESSYISAVKSLELLKAGTRKEQIKKLESQKLRAELSLRRAVKNQEDRKIKAPISGIISYLKAQIGEQITTNTAAIITDISQIELTAYISELYINNLEKGETIKAYFKSIDQEFEGDIIGISPRTAESRNTFPVKMKINNSDNIIKSGMNASVELITARANNVVMISQDALLEENGQNYIFIIKDSTAERREVEVSLENEDYAVITSGLKEGEKAAAVGKENLRDGIKVNTAAGGDQ